MTLPRPLPRAFDLGPPTLGDREFDLIRHMVEREAGIHLADSKRNLVVGRLSRRLRELGFRDFRDFCRLVESDESERVRMLDAICTNETHFFREPQHFEFVRQRVVPWLQERAAQGKMPRRLRVWSAACSTGEEPFSLAMDLLEHLRGWDVDIFATDLSTKVLAAAKEATWRMDKASEIPPQYLHRYMLKGTGAQDGRMRAAPELRERIRFQRFNLVAPTWPAIGQFDLLFCRNVLMYFAQATKNAVINRLIDHLAPDGYLFLGHAESLAGVNDRLRCVIPAVYAFPGRGVEPGRPRPRFGSTP